MGGFIVKSKAEDLLLWEQRINERTRSGLTVDEWCKKNGFNRHNYYYWNRRISQNQKSDKEVIFADVTPILSGNDNKDGVSKAAEFADFQIFFKNIQVTVPANFNPASLTGLMKVLQEL